MSPGLRITIRDARLGDVESIRRLEAEIFKAPGHRPWQAHELAAELADDAAARPTAGRRRHFLVADAVVDGPPVGRAIAGYALLHAVAGEAELLRIAVAPEFRRRGIARTLLEKAVARLAGDRVSTCFLEVRGDNDAAIAFYRRTGFAAAGSRRGYYPDGGDALVMRRPLAPEKPTGEA